MKTHEIKKTKNKENKANKNKMEENKERKTENIILPNTHQAK